MKKTIWFSAFRYVVPSDYEAWLEKEAANGWQVEKIGQWSSVCLTLVRDEPKKYRYIFDLQAFPKKEYKATYTAFGWEFVGQMASCFIWRKPYETDRPEAFTAEEDIRQRDRRVKNAVSVSFFMFVAVLAVLVGTLLFGLLQHTSLDIVQYGIGIGIAGLFCCYLGFVMRNIGKRRE